jgi:hypothetical protein
MTALTQLFLTLLLTLHPVGEPVVGELTHYHSSLQGGIMRNGDVYDENDQLTVAVGVDWYGDPIVPLNSWIITCRIERPEKRCLLLQVRDTGYFPATDLDVSLAAFKKLGIVGEKRFQIWWQVLGR